MNEKILLASFHNYAYIIVTLGIFFHKRNIFMYPIRIFSQGSRVIIFMALPTKDCYYKIKAAAGRYKHQNLYLVSERRD